MNRRKFLSFLAAGGIVTAGGLWLPGQKLISIPSTPILHYDFTWRTIWLDNHEPRLRTEKESM